MIVNKKRNSYYASLLLAAVSVVNGCGGGNERELSLLDADSPPVDLDAEHERLRNMQMLRVQDLTDPANPVWIETGAGSPFLAWNSVCQSEVKVISGTDPAVTNSCTYFASNMKDSLCVARVLQSISELRAEPMRIGAYLVPPQSSAANVALLEQARDFLASGMGYYVFDGFFGGVRAPCTDAELQLTVENTTIPIGRFMTELYVDAYHLYRDLTEQQVAVILSVADSERGSTGNLTLGQSRSFAQAELSRAAAAHLLVGGADGIHGDETNAFCASPELTLQGQRALDVLRQVGIAPALVTAEGVALADFLNGSVLTVPSGSVRERYKAFVEPELPDGKRIEDRLELTVDDFVTARQYLASEVKAFNRSASVTSAPPSAPVPAECLSTLAFSSTTDTGKFDYYVTPSTSWSIASGKLRQSSNNSRALAIHKTEAIADGYVEVKASSTDNDSSGVILRYQSNDSYYVFTIAESISTARMYRYDAGIATQLAEAVIPGFDWGPERLLRFAAQGSQLTASVDGVTVMSAQDATYSSGRVGVFSGAQNPADFDEFAVFSTTRTSTCSLGSLSATFAWYPATGTKPQELSHEYWATTARYTSTHAGDSYRMGSPRPDINTPLRKGLRFGGNLASFIEVSLFAATRLVIRLQSTTLPTTFSNSAADPLLRLLAHGPEDRPGRIMVHETDPATTKLVNVWGYSTGDGLRFVDADNLSCAVNGNIEGVACSIAYKYAAPVAMATADLVDFTQGVTFTIDDVPGQVLYLVRPLNPNDVRPGTFEALGGFEEPPMANGENHIVPIVPTISRRAAEVLKPSREWCTYPAVECDGSVFGQKISFDARVPLENELTSDGDGVESSWRHYLALARSAADEATVLADQYMSAGLELDRLDQAEQLREAQDRIRFQTRAEAELEIVQNVCGTAVEISALLEKLNINPVALSTVPACTVTSDCPGVYNASRMCIFGKCLNTTSRFLDDPELNDEWARLQTCIGESTAVDYATIGNTPVCMWKTSAGLCVDDKVGTCPSIAKQLSDGSWTCSGSYADSFKPADGTLIGPVTTTIGLHDNSNPYVFSGPCDTIRTLRQANMGTITLTVQQRDDMIQRLDESGLFDKDTLMARVPQVKWAARPGNHSAVSYQDQVIFETGTRGAAQTSYWPCASAEVSQGQCVGNPLSAACTLDCSRTPNSLFCQKASSCSDWDQRTPINQRLLKAVWGLHAVSGGSEPNAYSSSVVRGSPQLLVPTRYAYSDKSEDLECFRACWPDIDPISTELGVDGALKRWATPAGGEAYTTSSTLPADRDFWPRLNDPTQRYQVTNSTSDAYAIDPMVFAEAWENTPNGRASFSWGYLSGMNRISTWDGVSSFDSDESGPWSGTRAMLRMFNGERQPLSAVGVQGQAVYYDYFAAPNGRAADFNAMVGATVVANSASQMEHLVAPYDYSEQSLWDAVELYCEANLRADAWTKDLNTNAGCPAMPAVASVNDIPPARGALICAAETLRRRASSLVLQRMPSVAIKNLLSFSSSRAFPEVGGEMGEAVARLREALVRFRNNGLDLEQEIAAVQFNASEFFATLQQVNIMDHQTELEVEAGRMNAMQAAARMQLAELEEGISTWDAILAGGNAIVSGMSTFGVGAVVSAGTFINEETKADDRAKYQKRIAQLEERYWELEQQKSAENLQYNEFQKAKELAGYEYELYRSSINIARIVNNMKADLEALDGHLMEVEKFSLQVRRAISRLAHFESSEAAITPQIRGVLASRLDVGKRRYQAAHLRAVKYAFLAKRAIEQRLGMRLAEMRDDLPLVDAPQKWESTLCQSTGVDYDKLKAGTGPAAEMAKVSDYADPFIGEYVRKLEDVVESYTMEYGFQDGTDEAIISLRDDVANVRAECEVESQNLLYFSGRLESVQYKPSDDAESVGWSLSGCTPDASNSTSSCFSSAPSASLAVDGLGGKVAAYQLTFGASATTAELSQSVYLQPGLYRLSWYVDAPASGTQAMRVYDPSGIETPYSYTLQGLTFASSTWKRQHRAFQVTKAGSYAIAFVKPGTGTLVRVAAPMLENITATTRGESDIVEVPPPVFQLTDESRKFFRPICQDTNGEMFRRTEWSRECLPLCDEGFTTNCDSAQQECFWQTEFSLSQRDIESGRILSQSGFATGNFNYRIESVALNFVGTSLRSCDGEQTPQTCFAAGFVPYTVHHVGPYLVTNHTGKQFKADLFTGTIEHARGLGTERYLSNPISSTDRELLTPYIRGELQGRPLDGTYRVRVWDAPGLQFEAIEDVQLYLKYRYWTRTE